MKLALHKKLLLVATLLLGVSFLLTTGAVANDSFLTPEAELTAAADVQQDRQLGWAVSVSGDTAVVGAPMVGKAYVFRRTDSGWDDDAFILEPPPPPPGTPTFFLKGPFGFGYSVAASDDGNRVVVGAPFLSKSYVFERDGESWDPKPADGLSDGMGFGWSVAASGDMIAVGNPIKSATHVFAKVGGEWIPQDPLEGPDFSGFGFSVDIGAFSVMTLFHPHHDTPCPFPSRLPNRPFSTPSLPHSRHQPTLPPSFVLLFLRRNLDDCYFV